MLIYIASFLILFTAEIMTQLHQLMTINNKKQLSALTGASGSALWCLKIVVVYNQPLTILTAFLGAYLGSLVAWKINASIKIYE